MFIVKDLVYSRLSFLLYIFIAMRMNAPPRSTLHVFLDVAAVCVQVFAAKFPSVFPSTALSE